MASRVLIIENEDIIRRGLASGGFEIISANSIIDAQREISFSSPDVILVDLKMPGIAGSNVLENLKSEIMEDIPIIHITPHEDLFKLRTEDLGQRYRELIERDENNLGAIRNTTLNQLMENILKNIEAFSSSEEQRIGIATLIGLNVKNNKELIEKINIGFPFTSFEELQHKLDISANELGFYVQIPRRTLSRRKAINRFKPDESERILRFSRILYLALLLFDSNYDSTRKWLKSNKSALGGISPLLFSKTEIGAKEVEDLIGRLEHGVFI
jgi:putative toxin-antitoxin system antitoxin component (TIGR02293 family)